MREENRFSAGQVSEGIRFDVWRHVVRHQVGCEARPAGRTATPIAWAAR